MHPRPTALRLSALLLLATIAVTASPANASPLPHRLPPGASSWADLGLGAIRGVTLGPIENARHPGVGYGTEACRRSLREAKDMGANWVALTPFGRVWDLSSTGIDLSFEAPFEQNRKAVLTTIRDAHALGLSVMLVPHLWVETGAWRAKIDPGTDTGWKRWAASYRRFLLAWTEVAREGEVDLLSVGVEMRGWVTSSRAPLMYPILQDVRARFPGLLTYSGNWDDIEDTRILDTIDVLGVNAFYPLAQHEGASLEELTEGGERVALSLERLSRTWQRPVVLTEFGYTNRADPALHPWEWPDGMTDVRLDPHAQAQAYAGLLGPLVRAPYVAGFFVWRMYADPEDVSQEAEWGFSPRGKEAELVLRDAFAAAWAADGPWLPGGSLGRHRARTPGAFPWELSPEPSSSWAGVLLPQASEPQ